MNSLNYKVFNLYGDKKKNKCKKVKRYIILIYNGIEVAFNESKFKILKLNRKSVII